MNIQPCCQGCGKPYAQAKTIHPSEPDPETWICQECATEQAQAHEFNPDAQRAVIADRESMTNGEYAERGAITVCDYSGVTNPEQHNIADLMADIAHYSDKEGHNFRAILRRAIRYWEMER